MPDKQYIDQLTCDELRVLHEELIEEIEGLKKELKISLEAIVEMGSEIEKLDEKLKKEVDS